MRVSQKNNNVLLNNLRQWNNLSSDAVSKGQSIVVGYIAATGQTAAAPVVKTEEPKQEVVVAKPEPKQTPPTQVVEKKPEPVVEKKPEQVVQTKATETRTAATNVSNIQAAISGAGYFKTHYDQQSKKYGSNKDLTVTSGIFKTASGWQDAKYYALMDNVEPGTIVRITNPDNNKAIFAKVLGEMSGLRQNQGLEVRISNAAASALNVSDTDKFIVKVSY